MAHGFMEIDQVLVHNPLGTEVPETTYFVQYTLTMVGPDVPNRRYDTTVPVQIDAGDSQQTVTGKIRDGGRNVAANMGVTIAAGDLVVPAYTKG